MYLLSIHDNRYIEVHAKRMKKWTVINRPSLKVEQVAWLL